MLAFHSIEENDGWAVDKDPPEAEPTNSPASSEAPSSSQPPDDATAVAQAGPSDQAGSGARRNRHRGRNASDWDGQHWGRRSQGGRNNHSQQRRRGPGPYLVPGHASAAAATAGSCSQQGS